MWKRVGPLMVTFCVPERPLLPSDGTSGVESIVYTTANGEKLVAIFDPHETPKVGETIALGVEPTRVHVFDAETGNAI